LLALSLVVFSIAAIYKALGFTTLSGAIGILVLIFALLLGAGLLYAYLYGGQHKQ